MAEKQQRIKEDVLFKFMGNLQNDKNTYEQLGMLYYLLNTSENKTIFIDFINVNFIAANLFAVLGACLHYTAEKNKHQIYFDNVSPSIKSLMAKNRFGSYFNLRYENDNYKNCIEYRIFRAETEQLEEFEKYILLQIFNHNDIPLMSNNYRNRIIDNFLEIFNNVIDHANSQNVYVCGQFFRQSKSFTFSIVDIGLTFTQKISKYFDSHRIEAPKKNIEWAIKLGNSTKTDTPGGLGLTTLLEFLNYNKGSFSIISHDEFYEYNEKGERTSYIRNYFPGTVVTISVKLNDENLYYLDEKNDETIIF